MTPITLSTRAGSTAPPLAWPSPAMLSLLAILAVGLCFRLYGIHFGLPALNDPDELIFELGAMKMLSGPTLNPGWFGHPATTTMYVLALTIVLVFATGWITGWFPSVDALAGAIYADPSWMILPGRVAMALFGTACVFLTWRLGRELFGTRVGLIAAAILAFSPVHIAWSQVIRSDVMATFFLLLCLLAALRIAREGRRRDYVLAALWLGLAVATKWPFALGALAIAGAALLRVVERKEDARPVLLRASATFALSVAFLLLASPYLLLDHETLLRNLQGEAQVHHLGATGDGPLANAAWYLTGPMLTGLGIAGALAAGLGVAKTWRRGEVLAVLLSVGIAFFVVICVQRLVWERWALPLLPLLAILAGAGAAWLWHRMRTLFPRPAANILAILAGLALLAPLAAQVQRNATARLNDTRQAAARWTKANVPPGSTLLVEHFAFDILPQPVGIVFPAGDAGCVDARALLRGKISYAPVETARNGRSNVDYGTLPVSKRARCRIDYAILAHYDRYRHERANFPAEYASYRELIGRGRIVATFSPKPGEIGGPIVRIVKLNRR